MWGTVGASGVCVLVLVVVVCVCVDSFWQRLEQVVEQQKVVPVQLPWQEGSTNMLVLAAFACVRAAKTIPGDQVLYSQGQ